MSRKIVALGNSMAAVMALEEIRKQDPHVELCIVSYDGFYPYRADLLTSLLMKEVSTNQVFEKSKDWYEKNNIEVVLNKNITKVNVKRNKIHFDDKTQIDFDYLIISQMPQIKFPQVKAANKSGVYNLTKLKDIDHLIKTDLLTDAVVVEGDSLESFDLAIKCLKKGKEVYFITRREFVFADYLDQEKSAWLLSVINNEKLKIFTSNQIIEVLGDSDAKAVRLKTGKVLAASVIFIENFVSDFRVFQDSEINMATKMLVNDAYQTNYNHVFAIDQVYEKENQPLVNLNSYSDLIFQANKVASQLLGQNLSDNIILFEKNYQWPQVNLYIAGNVLINENFEAQEYFYPDTNAYKKVVIQENILKGFLLINDFSDRDLLRDQLKNKTPLTAEVKS